MILEKNSMLHTEKYGNISFRLELKFKYSKKMSVFLLCPIPYAKLESTSLTSVFNYYVKIVGARIFKMCQNFEKNCMFMILRGKAIFEQDTNYWISLKIQKNK